MTDRTLTGWHVLAIFGGGFAVIIAANLILAFSAVSTFPGLEVKNSYVASQAFDRNRAAQNALGWDVTAQVDQGAGQLHLSIDTARGPAQPQILQATLGRATHVKDDLTPVLRHDGGKFVAEVPPLAPGNWNLRLVARAENGVLFQRRIVIWIPS